MAAETAAVTMVAAIVVATVPILEKAHALVFYLAQPLVKMSMDAHYLVMHITQEFQRNDVCCAAMDASCIASTECHRLSYVTQ
eukprot:540399-Ditylum_brightwellii.AAC.1